MQHFTYKYWSTTQTRGGGNFAIIGATKNPRGWTFFFSSLHPEPPAPHPDQIFIFFSLTRLPPGLAKKQGEPKPRQKPPASPLFQAAVHNLLPPKNPAAADSSTTTQPAYSPSSSIEVSSCYTSCPHTGLVPFFQPFLQRQHTRSPQHRHRAHPSTDLQTSPNTAAAKDSPPPAVPPASAAGRIALPVTHPQQNPSATGPPPISSSPSTTKPAGRTTAAQWPQLRPPLQQLDRPPEAEKKAKLKEDRSKRRNRSRSKPKTEKERRQLVVAFVFLFAGDGGSHRRRRKKEGKKSIQIPPVSGVPCGGAWTHAPPVTVVRGKTRRHCSCCSRRAFLQFLEF